MRDQRSTSRENYFRDMFTRLGIDPNGLSVSPLNGGRMVVGASDHTATKLFELGYIVDTIASYTVNINRGRVNRGWSPVEPFVAIDLSAGAGAYLYRNEPLVGSPLLVLESLARRVQDYRLLLIERNPQVVQILKGNLAAAIKKLDAPSSWINVLHGDLTAAESWVHQNVRPGLFGLMIVDVNDLFGTPGLRAIAQRMELRRVDVLLHVSGTLGKWPQRRPESAESLATIDDVLSWFNKAYWQVAQVRGNLQWIWCYGTNNPKMRELGQRGFVSTETETGQQRLDVVRTTAAQRQRRLQPPLFEE